MAELVVLGFADKEKAESVLRLAKDLSRQELLDLEDAALAWRTLDGKIHVRQTYSLTAAGAGRGLFWGTLFGALFLVPVFGAAVGTVAGAAAGKLSDVGINDSFVKEIAGTLGPGRAAVFALVRRTTPDRVREALRPFGPTVIRTSLTKDREEELVTALRME
ncbi:DUF1269 domain-containing protein [Streptomyces sp. CRN 30]|uniref:DUF1269 domain-containing protein n=1 Tax=Streptomyces sp. CRN 30 TaxID=3075613 RepID=UPI002A82840A|nr:DUF1269 domain-containing protein [Streptomyces sp. CRN 30]